MPRKGGAAESPDLPVLPAASNSSQRNRLIHLGSRVNHVEIIMKRSLEKFEPGGSREKLARRQEPVSCYWCRKKKLKCDRCHPCSNCRARKLACSSSSGKIQLYVLLSVFLADTLETRTKRSVDNPILSPRGTPSMVSGAINR
jgi:hypothetical protein